MSNSYGFGNDEIKEESGWRYPLGIFLTTLILCAIFLYHYVGPDVNEIQGARPKPTISEEKFRIVLDQLTLAVPANYTVYPKDRRDGARTELSLYALWPTMSGYTPAKRDEFLENRYNGRRIDIILATPAPVFNEVQRLETLYLPHTIDKRGSSYDYGLTRFNFKEGGSNTPTNGYNDKELMVGTDADGATLVLFCYKEAEDNIVPPDCFREYELSQKISVRYYFKRHYLPEWKQIDESVRQFTAGLVT